MTLQILVNTCPQSMCTKFGETLSTMPLGNFVSTSSFANFPIDKDAHIPQITLSLTDDTFMDIKENNFGPGKDILLIYLA